MWDASFVGSGETEQVSCFQWIQQSRRLPFFHLSLVPEKLCSSEYRATDKAPKLRNPGCYTPWSEPRQNGTKFRSHRNCIVFGLMAIILTNIGGMWNFVWMYPHGSRDSSVVIATGYMLDERGVGVRVPLRSRIYSFTSSRLAQESTQPPIQWVLRASFPGVKRLGREADHSP
jgi:hypothetical protein